MSLSNDMDSTGEGWGWRCNFCFATGSGSASGARDHLVLRCKADTAEQWSARWRVLEYERHPLTRCDLANNGLANEDFETYEYTCDPAVLRRAQDSIAKCIFYHGLPLRIVDQEWFRNMLVDVSKTNGAIEIPDRNLIQGKMLDDVYSSSLLSMQKEIINIYAPLCLVTDGWKTLTRTHIMNVMIVSGATRKSFFYKSVPFPSQRITGEAIAETLAEVVNEINDLAPVRSGRIIGVLMDNTPDMIKAGDILARTFSPFFNLPCQCHALNLLLKSLGKLQFIKAAAEKASKILDFVRNHSTVLGIFHKIQAQLGKPSELSLPPATRLDYVYLTLTKLVEAEETLWMLLKSPKLQQWENDELRSDPGESSSLRSLQRIRAWLSSSIGNRCAFMESCRSIVELFKPVFQALRKFERVEGSSSQVHSTWEGLKAPLHPTGTIFSERTRSDLLQLFTAHQKKFHCPLYGAAHCLEPKVRSRGLSNELVYVEFRNVLQEFYKNDATAFSCAMRQMTSYLEESGCFARPEVKAMSKTRAYVFWRMISIDVPELANFAVAVVSQICSNLESEMSFSSYKHVRSGSTNRVQAERAKKLDHCYYNYNLLKRRSSYGVVEPEHGPSGSGAEAAINDAFGDDGEEHPALGLLQPQPGETDDDHDDDVEVEQIILRVNERYAHFDHDEAEEQMVRTLRRAHPRLAVLSDEDLRNISECLRSNQDPGPSHVLPTPSSSAGRPDVGLSLDRGEGDGEAPPSSRGLGAIAIRSKSRRSSSRLEPERQPQSQPRRTRSMSQHAIKAPKRRRTAVQRFSPSRT